VLRYPVLEGRALPLSSVGSRDVQFECSFVSLKTQLIR